jgi:hypothetical protein
MTEFGAVDVNALREGRTETFHGQDSGSVSGSNSGRSCSYRTIPRTTFSGSTSTSGATSA